MTSIQRYLMATAAFACATLLAGHPVAYIAQVTPTAPPADSAGVSFSEAELEKLVGPIALYPDDLIAIILPASTYPLQIVQASRFFDKRKANAQLQPDSSWDDSVKTLLNYPDVVKKMSDDLEWTEALGEAVVANSSEVLDAVQAFRRKAQAAGNLKTDPKQTIVVEQEIIQIVPTDPQVIYVPQYQPSTVVVAGSPVGYYPTQYPVLLLSLSARRCLATGLIWGPRSARPGTAAAGAPTILAAAATASRSTTAPTSTPAIVPVQAQAAVTDPVRVAEIVRAEAAVRRGGPVRSPDRWADPRRGPARRRVSAMRGGAAADSEIPAEADLEMPAARGRRRSRREAPEAGGETLAVAGAGTAAHSAEWDPAAAANHESMRGQSSRAGGGFSGQGGRQAGGFQQGGGARAGGARGGWRAGGRLGRWRTAGGGAARSGGGARGGRR